MTKEETREMIVESNMIFQAQLSNFMNDVRKTNEKILERLDAQDQRSQARYEEAERRHKESEEHRRLTQEFITTMLPARDGMITIQNLMRFFKWAPAIAIAIYLLIKKIFP